MGSGEHLADVLGHDGDQVRLAQDVRKYGQPGHLQSHPVQQSVRGQDRPRRDVPAGTEHRRVVLRREVRECDGLAPDAGMTGGDHADVALAEERDPHDLLRREDRRGHERVEISPAQLTLRLVDVERTDGERDPWRALACRRQEPREECRFAEIGEGDGETAGHAPRIEVLGLARRAVDIRESTA